MKRCLPLGMMILLFLLTTEEIKAQVVVRDSIRITRIPFNRMRPQIDKTKRYPSILQNGVVSGFVMPRNGILQIYYNLITRLDFPSPSYANLFMWFDQSGDSVLTDPLLPRFPDVISGPFTYFNGCFSSFETHDLFFYQNFSAPPNVYVYEVGRVAQGDTVQFFYDTQSLFSGMRDTLAITIADEVRLSDGTLAGWSVIFGEYDFCLDEWNDRLDVFIGVLTDSISIDISDPEEIWPTLPAGQGGNPGNRNVKNPITVRVTQNNQPLANQNVTITAQIILPSGGHDHTNQPPLDSLGVFTDLSAAATGAGTMTTSTDANGQIQLSYRAPGFGGQIELTARAVIIASVINPDTVVARDTLLVRIPGFDELDPGATYELVGAPGNHDETNDPCRDDPPTSQHNENHFGTQDLIAAIQNIATDYDSLHPGIRLRINDMSLEWGGLFDNLNNWRYVVNASHGEHRLGRNGDIGFRGIDPTNQCVNLNAPELLILVGVYTNVRPYVHQNDHVHIRVDN